MYTQYFMIDKLLEVFILPLTRAVIVLKGQVLSFLSLLPKFVFIARFHHSAFLPYEYIVLICSDQLIVKLKPPDAKTSDWPKFTKSIGSYKLKLSDAKQS